jgi:hexosaminidase
VDFIGVPAGSRQYSQAPVYVDDAPRFEYRGLLVDTARHFLPVPHLLHVIDALSYNKLNLMHWHIVDSCAFPCGSQVYPQLAEKGAWDPTAIFSTADLANVVAYAKARGVRVLPEWDVPGHGDWGSGIPQIMGW